MDNPIRLLDAISVVMRKQSDGNAVYQFALTGGELLDVADISRIRETKLKVVVANNLRKGEFVSPIECIDTFPARHNRLVFNPFDSCSSVAKIFEPSPTSELEIPANSIASAKRLGRGWQQRLTALSKSKI